MAEKDISPGGDREHLRARAEQRLNSQDQAAPTEAVPADEARTAAHELGVHRIELEMQADELRQSQHELQVSLDRYADLYDFAPVGLLTLSEHYSILELNLAAAALLGRERGSLAGVPFMVCVAPEDRQALRAHVRRCIASEERVTCEVSLVAKGGRRTPVLLQSVASRDPRTDEVVCRTAIVDLSERKESESLRRLNHDLRERNKELHCLFEFSRLVEQPGISLDGILQDLVDLMPGAWQHPEKVGVRLVCGGKEFTSGGFREGRWRQTAPIRVYGELTGAVEVHFVAAPLGECGDPFLEEEQALLSVIAERVGKVLERLRAEEALLELQRSTAEALAQLDTLQMHAPVGFAFLDRDFCFVRVNEELAAMNGIPVAGHLGRSVAEIVPGLWPQLDPVYRRVLAGETVLDMEVSGETAGCPGDGRHWLASYYPVRVGGEMIGVGLIVIDITERKRADEALRESERRERAHADELRTIMDATPVAILVAYDPQCQRIAGNPLGARLLGVPEGSNLSATPPPDEAAPPYVVYQHGREVSGNELPMQVSAATGQFGRDIELEIVQADGTRRIVVGNTAPLRAPDGTVCGVVGAFLDITDRKRIEEELREARAVAEAANKAKSRFLANCSHELRTPMNAILGMTEQALEEETSPGVRDCLETVRASADALLALLNDLLDVARVEAGKLTLESCPFRLRCVVHDTLKVLSMRAAEKALALRAEIAADVPEQLIGDPQRLRQVLLNLIGNSLKFTEHGEVVVRVRLGGEQPRSGAEEQHGSGGIVLRFEVADTGIGIAPDHLEHIFQPFTQAEASTSRRYGGTGLGLTITSGLVQLMGGHVGVRSEVGKGSVFHFTARFPLSADPSQPCDEPARPAEEMPPPARPLRILLAEDTPANQKLIVRILGKRGHAVEVAANGQEAVALLSRRDFDLVLMDVSMPIMDGLTATAAIRRLEQPEKARVPIVAMTAHAMQGDQERFLAAGMNAYLAKPVNSKRLVRVVEDLAAVE